MRNMQAIAPKMKKIQQKYKGKNDAASKEAMQREMMKLYQDNNAAEKHKKATNGSIILIRFAQNYA